MKKNIILFYLILLTGFTALQADEGWKDILSSNEIAGKWEGFKEIKIPRIAEMFIPATSLDISINLEYIRGSKEISGNMKMDLNKFLTDWLSIPEIAMFGLTKDVLWELMVAEMSESEADGFTVGGKYFFNYDLAGDADDVFLKEDFGKIQINRNGDKLRLLFFEDITMGLGIDGFNEIILVKK